MNLDLKNKVILVTGASGGIGASISAHLAQAGATVALHGHSHARSTANLAKKLGTRTHRFTADLGSAKECRKMFTEVLDVFGHLDVLVNNAGIFEPAPLAIDDSAWLDRWRRTLDVNLTSAALLSRMAINHFRQREGGRIVFIASRAAFRGETADYLPYAASKGGMVSLSRSIARSFGKEGITSFVVAPGFVRTKMAEPFIRKAGEKKILSEIALRRLTLPQDIAPLVVFIASGLLDHCTGATFDVNAGSYIR